MNFKKVQVAAFTVHNAVWHFVTVQHEHSYFLVSKTSSKNAVNKYAKVHSPSPWEKISSEKQDKEAQCNVFRFALSVHVMARFESYQL